MPTVLCNAGPLIALGKLNRLDLLAGLYGQVRTTRAVHHEVVIHGLASGMPDARTVRLFWQRQGWPIIEVPPAVLAAYFPQMILDPRETEVLAFAQTLDDPLVLLDDEAARAEARRLGLPVRGTLGVLAEAFHRNILTLPQIEMLMREIAGRPDIWIGARLCEQVLSSLSKPDS